MHGVSTMWLCAALLVCAAGSAQGQATDSAEVLAAMRANLTPVPQDVPAWDELPADLRRQVPEFQIQMHRWQEDPSQRFVLVDGRRISEDGVVARELWLRQITPDGMVLQFRDRFFSRAR